MKCLFFSFAFADCQQTPCILMASRTLSATWWAAWRPAPPGPRSTRTRGGSQSSPGTTPASTPSSSSRLQIIHYLVTFVTYTHEYLLNLLNISMFISDATPHPCVRRGHSRGVRAPRSAARRPACRRGRGRRPPRPAGSGRSSRRRASGDWASRPVDWVPQFLHRYCI